MLKILMRKLDPAARPFTRAYASRCWDVFPLSAGTIEPGQQTAIGTGIATAFDPEFVGIIDDRSSTGKASLTHLSGVFDADFRDEWIIRMYNLGFGPYRYSPDRAICQVYFVPIPESKLVLVDTLPESGRGIKKEGSSDLANQITALETLDRDR